MPSSLPLLASNGGTKLTVTGVRRTKGNAVDCPQIETESGQLLGVSYLPPAIAIGDRVSVTGVMGTMATCLGPVLVAEKVEPVGR